MSSRSQKPQAPTAKNNPQQSKRFRKIADLDYPILKKLSDRLDVPGERNWRALIENMPSCRYDSITVERFGMNANRSDGSPAYALLRDMSNRGVSYDELIAAFKKMQFDTALQDIGYRERVQITQQPEATPGVEGQQLVLECKATGVPKPSFLWFKEPDTPLPDHASDKLTIPRLTKQDAGRYCCRAENEVNTVFSPWVEVKVQKPYILNNGSMPPGSHGVIEPPKILMQSPVEYRVQVGEELRLFVEASCAAGGKLAFQWFRNGDKLQYGTTKEVLIHQVRVEDQGTYTCRVSSEHGGSALTNPTYVTVTDLSQHQMAGHPQASIHSSASVPQGSVSQHSQLSQMSQHPSTPLTANTTGQVLDVAGGGGLSPNHTSQQQPSLYNPATPSPALEQHHLMQAALEQQLQYTQQHMGHALNIQGHAPNITDYPVSPDVAYRNEYENSHGAGGGVYAPQVQGGVTGFMGPTSSYEGQAQYHNGGYTNMQNGDFAAPTVAYSDHSGLVTGGHVNGHVTGHMYSGAGGGGAEMYLRSEGGAGGMSPVQYDTRAATGERTHREDASSDGACGQDEPADLGDMCYDKVALLIGNKYYQRGELKLNTPENDAQDMAGVLLSAGFKVVSLVNLNKAEMEAAVKYFESLIGKNVYALFFFAGHGFEMNSKNYMMPVDADVEKNPAQCLCAQEVLQTMQAKGAKLSIVLLDMCRVNASTATMPCKDLYPAPQGASGYFVIGFSCSPTERAFEAGTGPELKEEDRDNSIFVSAFKRHLQNGSLGERLDTLLTDAAAGVRERGKAFNTPLASWQKPEIRHNLGEKLSLADPIKYDRDPNIQRKERSLLWHSAHIVPDSVVVGCLGNSDYNVKPGELALRLHYEAEHSNVLIVTAELLNGCLTACEVLGMEMSLHQQDKMGISLVLRCHEDNKQYKYKENTQFGYGHNQAAKEMDLMHFKIPDLQKIFAPSVILKVVVEYVIERRGKFRDRRKCEVIHEMSPPLYAKILSKVKQFPSSSPYVQPYNHMHH